MGRKETVELTNMCMVEDGKGNVLVQNRLDPNWSGIVYPGGHVEAGESITASVIREIREETGLTIENPTLCGVKQFWLDNGVRYIVFLFRADKFTGELHGSEEGDAFWLPREEFSTQPPLVMKTRSFSVRSMASSLPSRIMSMRLASLRAGVQSNSTFTTCTP